MNWARDVWPSERARLMSGHMMPTERQATEATVEILEMNSWLNDELGCEFGHEGTTPPCSDTVTHQMTDCTGSIHACSHAASWAIGMKPISTCTHCKRDAAECWRIESA